MILPTRFTLLLLILLICGHSFSHGRPVIRLPSSSSDLISDGVSNGDSNEWNIQLLAESTCEQTYGFLPCTTTVLGNLFLIIVYGFLMYKAATYLSAGSELLLEILGPGIVGGLFLPMLGALPDAMLILGN